VIENDKPGEKAHSINTNGFLLYPSDTAPSVMDALKSVKQRAKNVMFKVSELLKIVNTSCGSSRVLRNFMFKVSEFYTNRFYIENSESHER
jgi:hypothetical protein